MVLAGEVLPTSLPIMPIRPRPLFPGIHIPLAIREDQLPVVEWTLESGAKTLGLVLARDLEKEDSPENLHRVGVAGKILKAIQEEEGTTHILISCLERFSIQEVKQTSEGFFARVKYHYAPELSANQELKAYSLAIISTLKELVRLNPLQSEAIKLFLSRSSLDDPGKLADFAASLTTADGEELQGILEALEVRQRIDRTLVLLKKELEVFKLQQKITQQIEEKMTSQQREFFLKEQLKAIKQELDLRKRGKLEKLKNSRNDWPI